MDNFNDIDETIELPDLGSEFASAAVKLGKNKIKSSAKAGVKTVKGVAKLGKFVVFSLTKGIVKLGDLIFRRNSKTSKSNNSSAKLNAEETKETVSGVKKACSKIKELAGSKIYDYILYAVEIVLLVLCAASTVILTLQYVSSINVLKDYFSEEKYVTAAVTLICPIFFIVLFVQILSSAISLFKKEREPKFEYFTTLIGFYVYSLFVCNLVNKNLFSSLGLDFGFTFNAAIVVAVIYAVLRLFKKDFIKRLGTMIFALLLFIGVIIMFNNSIGNFFLFWIGSQEVTINISEMNFVNAIQSLIKVFGGDLEMVYSESIFIQVSKGNEAIFVPMGVIITFISRSLPYMLLFSAVGLIGAMLGNDIYQYKKLSVFKKNICLMLLAEVILLVCSIIVCAVMNTQLMGANINVGNVIFTFVFTIVLLLISCLPWGVAELKFRRKYCKTKKAED